MRPLEFVLPYLDSLSGDERDRITRRGEYGRNAFDGLRALLLNPEEMARVARESEPLGRSVLNGPITAPANILALVDGKSDLFELLEVYMSAGPHRRRERLELFADNYQVSYEFVELVLQTLGLTVEPRPR